MVIKMNKAEALKMYEKLSEEQGRNNGLWEVEYFDCAERYMKAMINACDKLEIEYSKEINDYLDEEEVVDLELYQKQDIMGYDLKQIIFKHLRDIILA